MVTGLKWVIWEVRLNQLNQSTVQPLLKYNSICLTIARHIQFQDCMNSYLRLKPKF